LVIK
jgi:hypothetical protein